MRVLKAILSSLPAIILVLLLSHTSSAQDNQFVKAVRAFENQIFNRECIECDKVFDRDCGECEMSTQDLGVYTPIEKDDSTFNDTVSIVVPLGIDISGMNPLEIHYSHSKGLAKLYDQLDSEIDKLRELQKRILNMNQFLHLMIAQDANKKIPFDSGKTPIEKKPVK